MEDLIKHENETEFEFHKRLVFGKLVDKTLSDEDYVDLSELVYKQKLSSDVCRREMYGSKYTLQLLDEEKINSISDNTILDEVELKLQELKKERIKFSTTKLEYNKWMRQDSRLEMFFDEVKESIIKIEVPDFEPLQVTQGATKIGLLGISDFHFGKIFFSVNNSYSEDIFYERMNKLISETKQACIEQNISQLHILNCGDDVEGMTLRISQLASLQYGLTDQSIKVARYMVKFLTEISKFMPITYHHVLCGNHSEIRAFGDKSFTFENMERIIVAYIHDVLLDNPRIKIPEYNGKFLDFKIFNYNIFAQHGQKIKSSKTAIANASQLHRKFYDVAYFGHLHHDFQATTNEASTHDCEVVFIPSIMGSDEFSDDNYFGGAKASAKLDIYEDGKCRKGSFKILLN